MILVFAEHITERLRYTFDFVFATRGIPIELTNDPFKFSTSSFLKINYSQLEFSDSILFESATVLFDEVLFPYLIEKSRFDSVECLAFDRISDPFASIFYVLTRMEEYTHGNRDVHDRFEAKNSILFKNNWLETAICDRWAESILHFIEHQAGKTFQKANNEVVCIPTFDIDNVRAFEWKPFHRRFLATFRDVLKRDHDRIAMRKKVKAGKKDPYDTFSKINEIGLRFPTTKVFWLLGDYAPFDKNVRYFDTRHQAQIQGVASSVEVGLHPSYRSNISSLILQKEKQRLEDILSKSISITRQHFLKLKLPETYQTLEKFGFQQDFTMGFADQIGFRCGTARPHFFFDLSKNRMTTLQIQPFVYMDGTLHEYMKLSLEESKRKIDLLVEEIQKYGGNFCFIWHNETIGDFGKWKGWSSILDYTLSKFELQ